MERSCPSCAISDGLPTRLELAEWMERSVQEERRAVIPGGASQWTERERASQQSVSAAVPSSAFYSLKSCPD